MMGIRTIFAGAGLAASLAACQSIPGAMSVAEYCADPSKATEAVCKLNVEIDGQKTALADTDLRLSQARAVADSASTAAAEAKEAAARAQATADAAMSRATAAMQDELFCETRTIQQTDVGTCAPGYKLMSCTQTRYTFRAGGLSILREINDEQCRFNTRVLEMQVRCCAQATRAEATTTAASGY